MKVNSTLSCEGGGDLAEVSQRSCVCPISRNVQGQAGQGSE